MLIFLRRGGMCLVVALYLFDFQPNIAHPNGEISLYLYY